MKKYFIALCGILALPAFAEVVPDWYESNVEYFDGEQMPAAADVAVEDVVQESQSISQPVQATTQPSTARSAVVRSANTASRTTTRNSNNASRPVSSRNAVTTGTARSSTGNVVSRSGSTTNGTVRRATTGTSDAGVARVGIVQTDTVGTPLYYSSGTASRVGVRAVSTSNSRVSTTRAATTSSSSSASTSTSSGVTEEELAQLTDFCKSQYYDCMDNFCNVLDDNQGRCSCSPNVKNYTKTEDALKEATESLKDVAQKIQYIGLTRDEIDTLFMNTEAEAQMAGETDSTQLKSDLDKIKKLITDVKTSTSSSSVTSDMSLDLSSLLNLEFSDSGFDLSTLFDSSSTTSSISNQRGEDLYKSGAARCKTAVLDSCKKQGVDTNVLVNSYDMEIDRQCIVYERSLEDANANMRNTVRNANSVLQKARLAVAQQKNTYDLRGCVNALDSCMQDEFVCGTDYEGCLDPTGRYIVDGAIVIGSQPGYPQDEVATLADISGLYKTWTYSSSNAWTTIGSATAGNLTEYVNTYLSSTAISENAVLTNMVEYLQRKVGYYDETTDRSYGMCMSVLNKCQDLTYDKSTKKFIHNNSVLREYLMRTLVKIKSSQDNIITSYAEDCVSEVSSCLASQGSNLSSGTSLPYTTKAALNACSGQIYTCTSVISSTAPDLDHTDVVTAALCGDNQEYNQTTMKCECQSGYTLDADTATCIVSAG